MIIITIMTTEKKSPNLRFRRHCKAQVPILVGIQAPPCWRVRAELSHARSTGLEKPPWCRLSPDLSFLHPVSLTFWSCREYSVQSTVATRIHTPLLHKAAQRPVMQRALGLTALVAIASATPVRIRGPPGNKGEFLVRPVFSFTSLRRPGVLVQMFQWNWDSIAQVKSIVLVSINIIFIDHYSGVHAIPRTCGVWFRPEYDPSRYIHSRVSDAPTASPPQEHIQGDQWFTDYQVGSQ